MRGVMTLALLSVVCGPSFGQHLGGRAQWQPQTENDQRLQQPVEIEIVGRAAVTGLPILSEKTGVSLSVAPEDLDTVGERKLTIIAKGLSLKGIMVQLCEALQECHWDVDANGPEPTYLLHRNSGVEQLAAALSRDRPLRELGEARAERLRTLETARLALKVSPEELEELEKTDLLVARTVRFAPLRGMVEGLLSLPPDQIEELLSTGRIVVDYGAAPEPLQEAARLFSRYAVDESPDDSRSWRSRASAIRFDEEMPEREWPRSFRATVAYELDGDGIAFDLWGETGDYTPEDTQVPFIASCPPSTNRHDTAWGRQWVDLLIATGTPDYETADQLRSEWEALRDEERRAKEEQRRTDAWVARHDPELQHTMALAEGGLLEFVEFQQMIPRQAELSVISDYFTIWPPVLPDEARSLLPLWRLLYLFCEGADYRWRKAGHCLTFHHAHWYDLARAEIPERLLIAYRKKLDGQSHFTLEDSAALTAAMGRAMGLNVPADLRDAGLMPDVTSPGFVSEEIHSLWSFFRLPISSDQLAMARGPDGLSFQEMTGDQRQLALEIAKERGGALLRECQSGSLMIRELSHNRSAGVTDVELRLNLRLGPEDVRTYSDSFTLMSCNRHRSL